MKFDSFIFINGVSMILGQVKNITYWNYLERFSTIKSIPSEILDVEVPKELLFFGVVEMGMLEIEFYPFLLTCEYDFLTGLKLTYGM